MKKLSVLIVLMLVLTISGVYATWTYTQATDVADEAVKSAIGARLILAWFEVRPEEEQEARRGLYDS